MKLGFIGAGFVARFQAVAVQQVRGLEIAGILRRRGAEALASWCRAEQLGEARIFESVGEMAKHVDVLCIYVPNYVRIEVMEQIAAAVKAGTKLRGVVVEKPLGSNMKEAKRLVELAKECKLLTAYYENQIFMKAIRTQREQLLAVARSMGPLTLTRLRRARIGLEQFRAIHRHAVKAAGGCASFGMNAKGCGVAIANPCA